MRLALARQQLAVDAADAEGDTALTLTRHLLPARPETAAELADILIRAGADPNHCNNTGWSALSYALVHQDAALPLTRALLNLGARVVPGAQQAAAPFRILLRSVLRGQRLDGARESIKILGQVMSGQSGAKQMKAHVLSSIVAEGSLLTSNGPAICKEIQSTLSNFWLRPKPLLHLSLQASRTKLGLKRLNPGSLTALRVAPRLQNYLSLKSTLPLFYSQTQNTRKEKTDKTFSPQDILEGNLSSKIRVRLTCEARPDGN